MNLLQQHYQVSFFFFFLHSFYILKKGDEYLIEGHTVFCIEKPMFLVSIPHNALINNKFHYASKNQFFILLIYLAYSVSESQLYIILQWFWEENEVMQMTMVFCNFIYCNSVFFLKFFVLDEHEHEFFDLGS